ncbi:SET domain-containing protein [Noviherbaspirillum sp.]|uniref:SET domain-containing protein n=1 Tax=Noviherbaspirillum sp. TaxID=1926288 RepID=UPI002B478440|nr:SET domain-containing protein-lysine N-methyltransferase [Noviherbaspirillum sp.]HJV82385.1 SET domain-containing protein-lysine N-methyltransferase [Noviherbaspirillum sp.]
MPNSFRAKPYVVKASPIHGKGVFATRMIPAGSRIIEYRGERIDWAEAQRRAEQKGGPLNHTFFFSLHDGRVIDGGRRGNAARFINHACEPNCEALEHEDGRVFLYALRPIARGEELSYNYALIYEGRHTPAVKRAFACRCGTPGCTGSYLAPNTRRKERS